MPKLSVIVCIDSMRQRAERCLSYLLAQENIGDIEILLIENAPPDTAPIPNSNHPSVRVLRLEDVPRTFGAIRASAIEQANAPIVAFVEEHAVVGQGWAQALIDAYDLGDWAGVGAQMQTLNPHQGLSTWIEPLSYMRWYAPNTRGEIGFIAGHNSSYRRDVLLSYGDKLSLMLETDIILQWQLKADGHQFFLEPSAKMAHQNETRWSEILMGFYIWGQSFANTRMQYYGYSLLARLARGLSFPLVPFVRTRQSLHVLHQKRHPSFVYVIQSAWRLWLCHFASALGQTRVFLLGINPHAQERFFYYEMNTPRALDGQPDSPVPVPIE